MYRYWDRHSVIVAVLLFALGLGSGTGGYGLRLKYHHPLKHTGRCTPISVNGPIFWFKRPNGEMFEMLFDNPPLMMYKTNQLGQAVGWFSLLDIVYKDDNADMQHFVSDQLDERVYGK